MQRAWRLRESTDFARVRDGGRVWRHPLLVLSVGSAPDARPVTRFGITVSRRVGTAVVRNRVKRRIREIIRLAYPDLSVGWDLVFVVRPAAASASYQELDAAVFSLLRRAELIARSSVVEPVER